SCAAGIATLQALTQDGLITNAARIGQILRDGLERLKQKHSIIREVRGKGMMIGVEMKFEVKDILFDGISEGVLLLYSGRNILRFLPPLVMTEAQVNKVLEVLDKLFTREAERKKNAQGQD
ncbi:MAG: aminotransferase class III-fold pyridoxal phosphate-dependent enzyme, partial [Candidatus Nitrosotenuis sp.]|nr:aminotransferase class III-fold pyridoxal phosphate-dependent enzyme [Candidatus Nitrosotenuis sp.]